VALTRNISSGMPRQEVMPSSMNGRTRRLLRPVCTSGRAQGGNDKLRHRSALRFTAAQHTRATHSATMWTWMSVTLATQPFPLRSACTSTQCFFTAAGATMWPPAVAETRLVLRTSIPHHTTSHHIRSHHTLPQRLYTREKRGVVRTSKPSSICTLLILLLFVILHEQALCLLLLGK
jgi:hypothetical protein